MRKCDYPDCEKQGKYDSEVCSEENEDETFDVMFCLDHYIYLLEYNGEDASDYKALQQAPQNKESC